MGLILDLAVAALALVVIGSLATLTWTFAVSAVRVIGRDRQRVADMRRSVADADARISLAASRLDAVLVEGLRRTAPDRSRTSLPGVEPDL